MSCVSLKLDLRYDGEAGGTRQTDQNMEQKVRTGHLTADTTTDPTTIDSKLKPEPHVLFG